MVREATGHFSYETNSLQRLPTHTGKLWQHAVARAEATLTF